MIKVISDGPYVMVDIEHDTQQEAEKEFRSLGYSIAYKLNGDQRNIALDAIVFGLFNGHEAKEREEKEECQKSKHLA